MATHPAPEGGSAAHTDYWVWPAAGQLAGVCRVDCRSAYVPQSARTGAERCNGHGPDLRRPQGAPDSCLQIMLITAETGTDLHKHVSVSDRCW